jgi:hypothetical protein
MQENREKLTLIAVNSTAMYLLSLILFFTVHQFITGSVAVGNDLNASLHYYGTDVTTAFGRSGWRKHSVIYTYTAAPIFAFFMAIVFKQLHYTRYKMKKGFVKLFVLWGFVHGLLFSFGNVITGVLIKGTGAGIGHAFAYAYLSNGIQWTFLGLSVLILVVTGFFVTRLFLQTSPTQGLIDPEFNARPIYILCVAVIPWAAGTLMMFLLNYPKYSASNILLWMLMVLILLPMLSFCKVSMRITLSKSKETVGISWEFVILCAIAILFYRLVLDSGIDMRFLR